jgi:hypothetical protein
MNRENVLLRTLQFSAAIAGGVAAWLFCLELGDPTPSTLYQESILLPCFLAISVWCCCIALLRSRSGTLRPTQFTARTLLIGTAFASAVLGLAVWAAR